MCITFILRYSIPVLFNDMQGNCNPELDEQSKSGGIKYVAGIRKQLMNCAVEASNRCLFMVQVVA